ncbi:YggS family pyridoxal phosphate-dependent enzyme [Schaalia sp. ZJ1691]|uniref:YggS family pyridoxal phosphate-dependent enzyme n=1 Tax=Schaalia sp. ZJ1691 TaxID=2709404 RepID=UPI0013EC96B5|nr:YggS family pyridoxal phosphate-dependent enzyme [Schaalia sp. ZJ1691]
MTISQAIAQAYERIDRAIQAAGRHDHVSMEIAVKTRTGDECFQAAAALESFEQPVLLGHNRVQEARATAEDIRRVPGARIHLIGPLQTNKINQALRCVDLIESVDSLKLVAALDQRTPKPLPVYVEVNVSGEDTKHGCFPGEVDAIVDAVMSCVNLTLAGFMTVGLNSPDEKPVREAYAHLRKIREATSVRLDIPVSNLELSMGMSRDLEWAIAEGATIVRLGTAIFGSRPAQ